MAEATIGEALGILSKVSGDVDKRLKTLESTIGKTLGASTGGGQLFKNEPKKKEKLVKEAAPVIVTDFGRNAEQDLANANATNGGPEKESKDPEKGGLGFIKKLIGPALLVLGGIAALVTGLMSDGPLKGFLNILAKGGIIGGIKLFAATAGKSLKKFGKLFAKILPKNLFKNVITAAKGFLSKIGKFLLGPFTKLAGKGGAKALFGTIFKLFMKFLKPVLKRIPGIGSLISWGFAISRFKNGDLVGGLIDVASGIATLFPGIGTGISIGLDVLNAFLDAKKGKEEDGVKPEGAPGGIGAFFGKIKDKILNNFPIKNLMDFYKGVGKVFKGDFKEGFKQMAFAIPFMEKLYNFLFKEKEEVNPETGEITKKKSIMQALRESMFIKFKGMWPKLPKWMKWLASKTLPKNVIDKLEEGSGETDLFEDVDIDAARDENTKKIYGEYEGMSAAEQIAAMEKDGKKINDGIVAKNGQVIIPSAEDTVYAMKDGGPLGKILNQTPKMLGKLIDVEYDSLILLKEQNLILKSILEKTGVVSPPSTNQPNQSKNFDQSGDAFRSLQMGY